jgi:hypothetical protein
MMHAANTVTELHIAWVDVFTAETSTYVELQTFYTAEWLRAFNFVIYFYFLVSFEEIQQTVALIVALNCVIAVKIFTSSITIRLPTDATLYFYVFISFFLFLPYMFWAVISPLSGVSQAVFLYTSRLKLIRAVCDSGVQALLVYFVWFSWLFVVYISDHNYRY